MKTLTTLGLVAALAGCSSLPETTLTGLGAAVRDSAFQSTAFAPADVQVLAPAGHELRTYALRACGATVCGSRAATLSSSAAGTVVAGAYPGTSFTLAPGGAGTLTTSAGVTDIVWDFVD